MRPSCSWIGLEGGESSENKELLNKHFEVLYVQSMFKALETKWEVCSSAQIKGILYHIWPIQHIVKIIRQSPIMGEIRDRDHKDQLIFCCHSHKIK